MSEQIHRRTGSATLASADAPFVLECGEQLSSLTLAYETYGRLNRQRNNVILVCHALTGSAHAAGESSPGKRGWWDGIIGPGKALDTEEYFIVCSNVAGGCYGSTGATSINPLTGTTYGDSFPTITIRDMVRAQRLLLSTLGIERLHAVAGGSMGGMQVLEWGLLFSDDVDLLLPLATCAQQAPWRIGIGAIAREAIELGRQTGDEGAGLQIARKMAMLTYRSAHEFALRFARDHDHDDIFSHDCRFSVERYLDHQGDALLKRFDAATYLTLLRAMDLHDITRDRGSLAATLGSITQPTLCLGITSDILYPLSEQQEIASHIPDATCQQIESIYGHDGFLLEREQVNAIVGEFLARHRSTTHRGDADPVSRQSETRSFYHVNHSSSNPG